MTELTKEELTEAFEYLDELRESGRTNMFGAPAYVEDELGWSESEAREATKFWMATFDRKSSVEDRVKNALATGQCS
jgi:hypothetical protein